MKRGIVFDLDGTLWDSSQEVVSSWNEVLKNYQKGRYLITLEQMKEAMGLPMLELGKKLWPSLAEEEILPLLNECMEKENLYLLSHHQIRHLLRHCRHLHHRLILMSHQTFQSF